MGQPRESDTRASCAMFDTESGKVEFLWLEQDVDEPEQKQDIMPHTGGIIVFSTGLLIARKSVVNRS